MMRAIALSENSVTIDQDPTAHADGDADAR